MIPTNFPATSSSTEQKQKPTGYVMWGAFCYCNLYIHVWFRRLSHAYRAATNPWFPAVPEDHTHLKKLLASVGYICTTHIDSYDWFVLSADDVYLKPEVLLDFLSSRNKDEMVWIRISHICSFCSIHTLYVASGIRQDLEITLVIISNTISCIHISRATKSHRFFKFRFYLCNDHFLLI